MKASRCNFNIQARLMTLRWDIMHTLCLSRQLTAVISRAHFSNTFIEMLRDKLTVTITRGPVALLMFHK